MSSVSRWCFCVLPQTLTARSHHLRVQHVCPDCVCTWSVVRDSSDTEDGAYFGLVEQLPGRFIHVFH